MPCSIQNKVANLDIFKCNFSCGIIAIYFIHHTCVTRDVADQLYLHVRAAYIQLALTQ